MFQSFSILKVQTDLADHCSPSKYKIGFRVDRSLGHFQNLIGLDPIEDPFFVKQTQIMTNTGTLSQEWN